MIKDRKIEISKKDYLTFKYGAILYDTPGLVTILWVCTIAFAVLVDYIYTRRSFIMLLVAIFMVGMYINNLFVKLPSTTKTEYEKKAFPNPEFVFSFTGKSIVIARESSSPSEIGLLNLSSSFETFTQFCFFVSMHNYIIVPKRLLSADEITEIRQSIFSLPRNKRKNPFSSGVKNTVKTFLMLAFITFCAVFVIYSYKMT
ncbi:MAG: hypothetical protein IKW02_00090 [Clostridia bacterium]|nr:hypothetical protein [Clostridia bacterium]